MYQALVICAWLQWPMTLMVMISNKEKRKAEGIWNFIFTSFVAALFINAAAFCIIAALITTRAS